MRALLISPESPISFWTMREACRLAGTKTTVPPLGLITAAALLPTEWEQRLVDLNTRTLAEEDWNWADLVMVTGMIVHKDGMLAIIREAKKRRKTVVAGGPYPTSAPEGVLEAGCDFLVRGEGERTIPMFVEALEAGKSGGIFESREKPDMTQSPVPRFDLLSPRDYIVMGMQTSRGCPFDCEFCDIVSLYGRKPRYKAPEQVIEELEALYSWGWRGEVFISDDNFVGSKRHARGVLDKLIAWQESRGEPFSFWTQASVDLGQDPEMIDLMTAANFGFVFIGIESPDEEVLTLNRKYQNIRNPLMESLENINRNGLSVVGSFVIGFDGEKKGAGERLCAFVEESNMPAVMINTLQVLPETRLWDRLKSEGRLLEEKTSGMSTGGRLNYVPTRPESEIMEEFADAWDYLYEPSRYLARAYRYYLKMRPTRSAQAERDAERRTDARPKAGKPLGKIMRSLLGFMALVWWRGLSPPTAGRFWRQLIGMRMRNPSRVMPYLNSCGLGESMMRLRGPVWETALRVREDSESADTQDGGAERAVSGGG